MSELFGKYRALVVNIEDPENRGRIKVECPPAYGECESPWCLPCTPFSMDNGGFYQVPSIGEMVWVEFEEGDTNFPILVGSLWQENSRPEEVKSGQEDKHFIIKTKEGNTIDISEEDGNKYIEIKDSAGSTIKFDSEKGDIIITAINDLVTIAGNKNTSRGSQVHHN